MVYFFPLDYDKFDTFLPLSTLFGRPKLTCDLLIVFKDFLWYVRIVLCLSLYRYPLELESRAPSQNKDRLSPVWDAHVEDYKNPLHLDVVDRYLRLMGDKSIPDLASLESFYPPWVAGIDLPQPRCCGFFVSFTNKHK